MVFEEMPIWIQCHNVPLAFMHSDIIRNIGSKIGRVLEVDEGDDGHCAGRFVRVRVSLNINKPLQQVIWILTKHSKEEICIILLYERLPNFCYKCGKIGHVERDYDKQETEGSESIFGNCLRANSVSEERKVFSQKSNSDPSNASPSRQHQEVKSDMVGPDINLHEFTPVDTESSHDKSTANDNLSLLNELLPHELMVISEDKSPIDLDTDHVDESTGVKELDVIAKPIQKHWKRLARENNKRNTDEDVQFIPIPHDKRVLDSSDDTFVNSKREKASINDGSEFVHVSAVAVVQSRQSK